MKNLFKSLASTIGATLIVTASSLTAFIVAQPRPSPTPQPCPGTPTDYPSCSPASRDEQKNEKYVTEQVRKGLRAVLDRGSMVRGCFIRDLLTIRIIPEMGIVIQGATVEGPIDIRNEEIPTHVELIDCTFEDGVNMKRTHFTKGLSFRGSSFGCMTRPGRLDAEDAIIDSDFILDACTFNSCLTFLKSMKIGVDLSLAGAKFLGKVDFTGTDIGGSLFAGDPETRFRAADFDVRVGMDADFSNVEFNGPAHFGSSKFKSLAIEGATFNDDVNFKSAKIGDFYLGDKAADRFKGKLMIEDLTFQYMSPEDLEELKLFAEKTNASADQSSHNAQFYSTLETMLRKHGHDDWGDEVFIAGKRKERQYQSHHWYSKAWGYFLDGFIGYGRHVARLLWWSLIFLGLGCGIFLFKNNMERKEPERTAAYTKKYNPLLYSLDLFIPIVGLGYADNWTPTTLLGRIYKPVHMIIGHLFVPIGLAAWTGLIK